MDEAWRSALVEDITFIISGQTVVVEGDRRFSAHDQTITSKLSENELPCYTVALALRLAT